MSAEAEVLILCEGYQDRAFWDGCLLHHFRCAAVNPRPSTLEHKNTGSYTYRTEGGRYVHVIPCAQAGGLDKVLQAKLKGRFGNPFEHIVHNSDVDLVTVEDRLRSFRDALTRAGAEPRELGTHHFQLDQGQASLLCWYAADASVERLVGPLDRPSIPAQQCLERLACVAVCRAYPGRGDDVQRFLSSRRSPPTTHLHKAAAMSHMAGWYADHGSEAFYSRLWQVPGTREVLQVLLREQPGWSRVEGLVA